MTTPQASSPDKTAAERYFYSAASVLLLVLAVTGFQLFYFHGQAYPGRPLTPQIRPLVITHAVAMSVWMLLAVAQPLLVAQGKRRLHMAAGRAGALLAACLVVLGISLGIEAARVAPPGFMFGPMTAKQFMSVPVLSAVLFGIFVALGVLARKHAPAHRPAMFMASMTAVSAAVSRIDFFNHLFAGSVFERIFGVSFFSLVVAGLFFLAKCVVFRRFDRWFGAALAVLALWLFAMTQLAPTPAWDSVAVWLLGLRG